MFDYQSVCHCSKTGARAASAASGLTTSQFVTAPKLTTEGTSTTLSLTTSQFVTAPKPSTQHWERPHCLTTSQFVTAPKLFAGCVFRGVV